MALPTVVGTWQHTVNGLHGGSGNASTDTSNILLQIKNAMIGFGTSPWTVRYSCNSSVAGTVGDGVDRWLTTANVVDGTQAGQVFSWIVLKQAGVTGANAQILIAYLKSPVGSQGCVVISFSANAGFTGGTTNTKPSATDEITLIGSSNTQGTGINGVTAYAQRSFRVHAMMTTDGKRTRIIIAEAGVSKFFFFIDELASPTAGMTMPIVAGGQTAATACPTYANFYNSARVAFASNSVVSAGFFTTESCNNGALGTKLAFASDISGEFVLTPIGFATTAGGLRGRQGLLQDMWFGSSPIQEGSTYPNDATRLFVQFGNMVFPWNGTVVQMI